MQSHMAQQHEMMKGRYKAYNDYNKGDSADEDDDDDDLMGKLKKEMAHLRASEGQMVASLSNSKKRIQDLEAQLVKKKEAEANLYETLVAQTKQIEQTKILLEESKLEVTSLKRKLDRWDGPQLAHNKNISYESQGTNRKGASEWLRVDIDKLREDLIRAQEEIEELKSELKMANEAEENTNKGLEDLALALKEVATEAGQAKERLAMTELELKHAKQEAERLRELIRSTEHKYKVLLDEAKKEAEFHKNTSGSLRIEAEDAFTTWGEKEAGFINCIKLAEEEKMAMQQESDRLREMLLDVEEKNTISKEENQKLRDILKQAINESSVAKEAAGIAQEENSQLKDNLSEMEEALIYLLQENENLKIHEAATLDHIRELKRLLYETSSKELKKEEKEMGKKSKAHAHHSFDSVKCHFGLSLFPHHRHREYVDDEDDALGGSIFDIVDSSDSGSHYESHHETHDEDTANNSDEFHDIEETHFEDIESDKSTKKKKALLRRFGDLLRRRSFHKSPTDG